MTMTEATWSRIVMVDDEDRPTMTAPFDVKEYARRADRRPSHGPPAAAPGDDDGPLDRDRVPSLTRARADIPWSGMGPLAVHLALRIDGVRTLGALLDATNQPWPRAARAFRELLRLGVVRIV
jgi:hypothetical protein